MIPSVANHRALLFNDVRLGPDELKLPLESKVSDTDVRPSSLGSLSISSESVPELSGVPSLEFDLHDTSHQDLLDRDLQRDPRRGLDECPPRTLEVSPWGRRERRQKVRAGAHLDFVDCTTAHPLIPARIERTERCRAMHPNRAASGASEYDQMLVEQCSAPVEMATYSTKYRLLVELNSQRHFRPNAAFLRMYIAEREMVKNNKLQGLYCRPILPPRNDSSARTLPVSVLGMSYKWPTYRKRRQWGELTAEDVDRIS